MLVIADRATPMVLVRARTSARARILGMNPSSSIASLTACTVSGATIRVLLRTCDTVDIDTPARCATSAMVTKVHAPFRNRYRGPECHSDQNAKSPTFCGVTIFAGPRTTSPFAPTVNFPRCPACFVFRVAPLQKQLISGYGQFMDLGRMLAQYDSEVRACPQAQPGFEIERTGGVTRLTGHFNFICCQ